MLFKTWDSKVFVVKRYLSCQGDRPKSTTLSRVSSSRANNEASTCTSEELQVASTQLRREPSNISFNVGRALALFVSCPRREAAAPKGVVGMKMRNSEILHILMQPAGRLSNKPNCLPYASIPSVPPVSNTLDGVQNGRETLINPKPQPVRPPARLKRQAHQRSAPPAVQVALARICKRGRPVLSRIFQIELRKVFSLPNPSYLPASPALLRVHKVLAGKLRRCVPSDGGDVPACLTGFARASVDGGILRPVRRFARLPCLSLTSILSSRRILSKHYKNNTSSSRDGGFCG